VSSDEVKLDCPSPCILRRNKLFRLSNSSSGEVESVEVCAGCGRRNIGTIGPNPAIGRSSSFCRLPDSPAVDPNCSEFLCVMEFNGESKSGPFIFTSSPLLRFSGALESSSIRGFKGIKHYQFPIACCSSKSLFLLAVVWGSGVG
jgi:hypothetical protein